MREWKPMLPTKTSPDEVKEGLYVPIYVPTKKQILVRYIIHFMLVYV